MLFLKNLLQLKKILINLGLILFSLLIGLNIFLFISDILIIDEIKKKSISIQKKLSESKYYIDGKNGLDKETNIRYTWGNKIIHNSFNFREKEFKISKPKNVYRILVIGDSYTWGAGLPLNKRYSHFIEDGLNKKNSSKYIFETVVFSYGGGFIDNYEELIKRYTERVEADLVIIGIMYNDPNRKGWSDEGSRDKFFKYFEKYKKFLNLIVFIRGETFKLISDKKTFMNFFENLNLVADPFEANYKSGYGDSSPNWLNFNDRLESINNFVIEKTKNKPYLLLLTPALSSVGLSNFDKKNNNYLLVKKMFDKIEIVGNKKNYITINTLPEFKKRLNNKYLALNIYDAHPNELSHKVYADIFIERFKKDFD